MKKQISIFLVATVVLLMSTQAAFAGWNHLVSSYKWTNKSVTYDFDDVSWPATSDWQGRVNDSASKWNSVSSLKFSYSGLSYNDWYFRYLSDSTTNAITRVYTNSDNVTINEVNVDVNNRRPWYAGTGSPGSNQDLYSVVLHEFGHWYHLNDDYNHPEPVMWCTLQAGQVKRTLITEDIDAAKYMYP